MARLPEVRWAALALLLFLSGWTAQALGAPATGAAVRSALLPDDKARIVHHLAARGSCSWATPSTIPPLSPSRVTRARP
ncbi:hypothetical protein [Microbacterium sp. NPDC055683]